jgi:hypothetical protein
MASGAMVKQLGLARKKIVALLTPITSLKSSKNCLSSDLQQRLWHNISEKLRKTSRVGRGEHADSRDRGSMETGGGNGGASLGAATTKKRASKVNNNLPRTGLDNT